MKCIANRDYTVQRAGAPPNEIRALWCAYCPYTVSKRTTPKPKNSKSGLGRYNRMRGEMVRHLHAQHRAELEAANAEALGIPEPGAVVLVEANPGAADEATRLVTLSLRRARYVPPPGTPPGDPTRAVCPRCRRRYYVPAEEAGGSPIDPLTGAAQVEDLCTELDTPPPSVEGRHLWYLYRVLRHPANDHAHLIGPDLYYGNGRALCGQKPHTQWGWIRVDAEPPSPGPADRETCPKCQAAYNVRPDQIVWNDVPTR